MVTVHEGDYDNLVVFEGNKVCRRCAWRNGVSYLDQDHDRVPQWLEGLTTAQPGTGDGVEIVRCSESRRE